MTFTAKFVICQVNYYVRTYVPPAYFNISKHRMSVLDEWASCAGQRVLCKLRMEPDIPSSAYAVAPVHLQEYLASFSFNYTIAPDKGNASKRECMQGELTVTTDELVQFVCSNSDLSSEALFQECVRDASSVTLFGCTSAFAFDVGARPNARWFPHFIYMQRVLHRYLAHCFAAYRDDRIVVRFTASVEKHNLSKNGCVALLGLATDLAPMVRELNEAIPGMHSRQEDAADHVLLLPIAKVIDAASERRVGSDVDILRSIREHLQHLCTEHTITRPSNAKVRVVIEYNLTRFLGLLIEVFSTSDDASLAQLRRVCECEDMCVLVFLKCWADKPNDLVFNIPGGKRELGETQWQGLVRETEEEVHVRIADTVVSPTDAAGGAAVFATDLPDSVQWLGYLHHSSLYVSLHVNAFELLLRGRAVEVPEVALLDRLFWAGAACLRSRAPAVSDLGNAQSGGGQGTARADKALLREVDTKQAGERRRRQRRSSDAWPRARAPPSPSSRAGEETVRVEARRRGGVT